MITILSIGSGGVDFKVWYSDSTCSGTPDDVYTYTAGAAGCTEDSRTQLIEPEQYENNIFRVDVVKKTTPKAAAKKNAPAGGKKQGKANQLRRA